MFRAFKTVINTNLSNKVLLHIIRDGCRYLQRNIVWRGITANSDESPSSLPHLPPSPTSPPPENSWYVRHQMLHSKSYLDFKLVSKCKVSVINYFAIFGVNFEKVVVYTPIPPPLDLCLFTVILPELVPCFPLSFSIFLRCYP